jgi:hypothetical protein
LVPAPLGGKPVAAFPVFLTIIIGDQLTSIMMCLYFPKKPVQVDIGSPFSKLLYSISDHELGGLFY